MLCWFRCSPVHWRYSTSSHWSHRPVLMTFIKRTSPAILNSYCFILVLLLQKLEAADKKVGPLECVRCVFVVLFTTCDHVGFCSVDEQEIC